MDKIWYLKRIDILSGLGEDELRHIEKNSIMKEYVEGQVIYSPNRLDEYIYFLKRARSGSPRSRRQAGKSFTPF